MSKGSKNKTLSISKLKLAKQNSKASPSGTESKLTKFENQQKKKESRKILIGNRIKMKRIKHKEKNINLVIT